MTRIAFRLGRLWGMFRQRSGTWEWACEQMEAGRVVTRACVTGSVRYRTSDDGQGRVEWTFDTHELLEENERGWENAFLFLKDFRATDWILYRPGWNR